jgi:hypothetical protein
LRIIQFVDDAGQRAVAALADEESSYRRVDARSTRELALDAYRAGRSLKDEVASRLTPERIDAEYLLANRRLLVPLDHPDPAHVVLAITGLTHLGGAQQRDAMHAKLQADDLSDSMKMFKLGLEGGKPEGGAVGVQPEWAYKGDGEWLVQPEGTIVKPGHAEGGGEEAEVCGAYVIADDGTPLRVGYALGNEYSDHVMERRNYLYLAHSKLRPSSFGPELLVGDLPENVEGDAVVRRNGKVIWQSRFLSGEANMTHSIANLEEHHFKYAGFRRPGDVHVYYFGASVLSFGDGLAIEAGDSVEIRCPAFGMPLRQTFAVEAPSRCAVKAL